MTPLRIRFTGLELDPADIIDRVHTGVIPLEWHRYRFPVEYGSVSQINRWLHDNIDGRWAIMISHLSGKREITIAFERDYAASMFVLSDGARQCCLDLDA